MTLHPPVQHGWQPILTDICKALGYSAQAIDRVQVVGDESLPSCFPVTDLAVASIAAASLAVSELIGVTGAAPAITVDRRLSSLWFGFSIRPIGWAMPAPWDAIAGDYCARDGWVKLHTNAPRHRAAALTILGCEATREAVAAAVAHWQAEELEDAVVAAGGAAAAMRSTDVWSRHPQGVAVISEPLIAFEPAISVQQPSWPHRQGQPLHGIRVLDLTRVLAGPVATRFLAGLGAEVLRVDPPDWDEPGVIPEVTLGKRCTRLNLRDEHDRALFERLLADADVLVHGYRAGALDGLGYDRAARQAICPCLIDVSLNAYGHTGPWNTRRGFDSLVQMSSGIAEAGMAWRQTDRPFPLPVQALDHATGYVMAAAVVHAIGERLRDGRVSGARLSLARTAKLLIDHLADHGTRGIANHSISDENEAIELTSWGPAHRVRVPTTIQGVPLRWDHPATALGSSPPDWNG